MWLQMLKQLRDVASGHFEHFHAFTQLISLPVSLTCDLMKISSILLLYGFVGGCGWVWVWMWVWVGVGGCGCDECGCGRGWVWVWV